ncbi:MAG: undecaprenyl-diphosphatase UppP [Anaerolineaceae bacterium]
MSIIQSIILGILQGLTEFLPISSSGHLVILPYLLGWHIPADQSFSFDVLVQLGTLLAVIVYFRKDLADIFKGLGTDIKTRKLGSTPDSRTGWYLILATIPAGFAGLFIKDVIEQAFSSPNAVAFFLFGTALLLILAEVIGKKDRDLSGMRWFDALWIGLFQVLSLFPGLSRSGSCIAGGMTRNLDRKSAGRFSFLMSIPIMAAAGLLSLLDLFDIPNLSQFLPVLVIGFVVAGIVGYFAITWLMNFVQNHSLFVFAGYCLFLGAAVLAFGIFFPQADAAASASETPVSQEVFLPQSVVYSPELDWLAPTLATCMHETLDTSLPLLQSVAGYQIDELRFTFPSSDATTAAYAYQVSSQSLQLSLNAANPLRSLNRSDMSALLQGIFSTWQEFFQNCASCAFSSAGSAAFDAPVKLYIYPASDPYQTVINQAFDLSSGQMGCALFIPDAESLLTTLQLEAGAAGFLPQHWIPAGTSTVSMDDLPASSLELPILAVLDSQPTAEFKDLILCVQSSL